MGIIDSLSAGYRFLFRCPQLLLIPVLLDLFLWFVPRLSIAPLLQRLADFYQETATVQGVPDDLVDLNRQMAEMLNMLGEQFNLLDLMVSSILLHVPSLMTVVQPLPGTSATELNNPLLVLALAIVLSILSILIGVVYISLLAQNLPIGEGERAWTTSEFLATVLRQWLQVLLFVLLVMGGLLAIYIPASIGIALLSLISPALGSFAGLVLGGLTVASVFYLYFATIGMVMDNLSIRVAVTRSFGLVRHSFWPTLGFVILTNMITLGFALLLNPLAMRPPAGTIVAILGNAYIGTGIVLGLLVFYRTRHLQLNDLTVGS